MRKIAMAAALLVAAPAAAWGQSGEVRQLLEQAGRAFESGSRFAETGNRGAALDRYREALRLVDRAAAMAPPTPEVVFGRREIMFTLGEALTGAGRHAEAADLYARMAGEISGDGAVPAAQPDRQVLARALRGQVGAALSAGRGPEARAALTRLISVGRAMQAADPTNAYLTRGLASDLQGEVVIRWLLEDREGSAALALETLGLFRSLHEANPGSDEALRARFVWAWVTAELNGGAELWREAVTTGEALAGRGELRREERDYLERARAGLREAEEGGAGFR